MCCSRLAGTHGAGFGELLRSGEPTGTGLLLLLPPPPSPNDSNASATASPALSPASGVVGALMDAPAALVLALRQFAAPLPCCAARGLPAMAACAAAAAAAASCAASAPCCTASGVWLLPLPLATDSRVGVLGAAAPLKPPACDVRVLLALPPVAECRGEPLCGGVLTPASAAATAAAGVMLPAPPLLLPAPQSPPQRPSAPPPALLRASRVGVLAVGADRMLSMNEVTAAGAGEGTVRGLPIDPPTPDVPVLTGDSAGDGDTTPFMRAAPLAYGLAERCCCCAAASAACVLIGDRCTGRSAAAAAAALLPARSSLCCCCWL